MRNQFPDDIVYGDMGHKRHRDARHRQHTLGNDQPLFGESQFPQARHSFFARFCIHLCNFLNFTLDMLL
jgi:hypothetical protein